ncbi:hypothetical protein [Mycobacterium sp. Aquia_213]|uniref:hypothetical protein n=1 Tax=Mycobacterium sp. Aquia_213 TaxID=2991728 RepID=UPI00226E7124|nr:hypothetical protein [Mycobacterium sp. Aquia_213]WAC92739.1 hypothetical protein LMQ14_06140 [Mycobacterium sp. Aquia_213]
MTVPPGGPYGQDPYGANPYGQGPYWGGPPQGGPPQGGPPQGGPPPYPPGGPYSGPQSGAYPYPPTGPFTNPQGGMDPSAPGYPGQPFGQSGPQYAPGWPPGSYPPGPPPNGPRSNMPWLIVAGIAVLGVIALVVILIVSLNNEPKSPKANPSTTTAAPTSQQPGGSGQTASDCTPNVSGGDKPAGGAPIKAGKLSFPANAAPGWMPFSDDQTPNLIGAVGLAQEVPGASQWVMQAEVAITNFVPSMDVTAQAAKLMNCVAEGPGYSNASPTLGPIKKSSITVEGIKAARVDADVTIADPARNVKGDSVVIIAVDTKPVTIFLGATPIGDAASAGLLNQVIGSLKVSK